MTTKFIEEVWYACIWENEAMRNVLKCCILHIIWLYCMYDFTSLDEKVYPDGFEGVVLNADEQR